MCNGSAARVRRLAGRRSKPGPLPSRQDAATDLELTWRDDPEWYEYYERVFFGGGIGHRVTPIPAPENPATKGRANIMGEDWGHPIVKRRTGTGDASRVRGTGIVSVPFTPVKPERPPNLLDGLRARPGITIVQRPAMPEPEYTPEPAPEVRDEWTGRTPTEQAEHDAYLDSVVDGWVERDGIMVNPAWSEAYTRKQVEHAHNYRGGRGRRLTKREIVKNREARQAERAAKSERQYQAKQSERMSRQLGALARRTRKV